MDIVILSSMAAQADPKREAILAAAFSVFRQYGFRRTSMEDIAREAGVSRASLYLHFRNKEEIFRTLAGALQEQALEAAESALKARAPIQDRVREALEAKVVRMLDIVESSPHGAELMDESGRQCGDLAAAAEERLHKLLTAALREAARRGEIDLRSAGLSAPAAAELLRLAAYGLKQRPTDSALFRGRLARLVAVLFSGLGA